MTSHSRTRTAPIPAGAEEGKLNRLRQILLVVLWSPSILLTGMVHLVCRPITKQILISAVVLDIPLQWGMHIGTRADVAEMGAMDGFDLSITTLSLVGLYLGWLFTERAQRRPLRIVWNWPIAAYTAAVAISLFAAMDVQLGLYEVFLILEMLLLYVYFAANITSRKDVENVVRLVLIGGIIESVYMLVLAGIGHEMSFIRAMGLKSVIYHPSAPGEVERFGGTVGSPNSAAAYLAMVITLALAARFLSKDAKSRRISLLLLPPALIALVLTLSRGGWVEVLCSAAILLGAGWLRTGVTGKRALLLALALCMAMACLYFPNPVSNRLTKSDNGSAQSRLPLMQLAGHMIADNPIVGVGTNNFAAVMRHYEGPEFRHAWIYTVHNQFLLVWAETGAIGLLAYLWILGSLIHRGWRLWKERDPLFAPLGLGIVAVLCGLVPHMMVEDFSSRPIIQFVWIIAALVTGCELILSRERLERRSSEEEHAGVEATAFAVR